MGMFDWYEPAGAPRCPWCGTALREWQGKDATCALLVWREGARAPIDHRVKAASSRGPARKPRRA